MPTNIPLPVPADEKELTDLLNDQEVKLARRFMDVHGVTTGDVTKRLNLVTIEFDINADLLKRLNVVRVPIEVTVARINAAGSADAARAVQDQFRAFISPLLDKAEMLDRAEVFFSKDKDAVEVVVLRAADPLPTLAVGTQLPSSADWPWKAFRVGDDIVVRGSKTTCFGGADDAGDNGETACGFPTKGHPELHGCALPLDGFANSPATHAALDGTPLPKMPFGLTAQGTDRPEGAHVEVTDPKSGLKTVVPVIDLGPAKKTGHALDLTVATARLFKSNATANNFSITLDYRIIQGAKFLKT